MVWTPLVDLEPMFETFRTSFVVFFALVAVACGGSQAPRGPAFCDSYKQNYTNSCRQHCESQIEFGDTAGVEACKKKCAQDLADDDTYAESCSK
jgi:hypothetical protein